MGAQRATSQKRQVVAGVQLFEDQLPSGISVTYYVEEQFPTSCGQSAAR